MVTLNDAIDTALSCVCIALEEAARPACQCYPTIGEPLWRPCCECGDTGTSGELTASLETMYPIDGNTLLPSPRIEACRKGPWGADIALDLTRCFPTLQEDGELPPQDEVGTAAREMHDDADIIRRALTCCPDLRLRWRSLGVDLDPNGGCSKLTARITVAL